MKTNSPAPSHPRLRARACLAVLAASLTVPAAWAVPAQQAYIKASNTGAGDYFGWSVAISGDTMVVGAAPEDSNATGVNGDQADNSASFSGAAYIFTGLCPSPELAIVPAGYFIRFNGTAGCTYDVQRAPNLAGPWATLATVTALASGPLEYHDRTPPPGQAFYRTSAP